MAKPKIPIKTVDKSLTQSTAPAKVRTPAKPAAPQVAAKAPPKAKTAPKAKPAPAKTAPRTRAKAKPKAAPRKTPARKTAKPAQAESQPEASTGPGGRPSTFTPEVIEAVCTLIAEGHSGRETCEMLGLSQSAMYRHLTDDKEFQEQYARAREMQADLLFGQIIKIADTPLVGTKEVGKEWGTEVTKADMIEHRRLQVDARKWLVVKLAPRKYGEKLQVGGADDLPALKHQGDAAALTPAEAYMVMIGQKPS